MEFKFQFWEARVLFLILYISQGYRVEPKEDKLIFLGHGKNEWK